MDISVVIPLYNEAESLPELFEWIERVMREHHFSHEVIFINDGSTDNSWEVIEQLKQQAPDVVRAVKFRRNYGKSPGLNCGFQRAKGDVVITMDADLQDSPDEIPELYRMITEDGYDLVSGWKKKRYDPLSKTIPTKLFNATARRFSGIHNLHDFNCGLKAYKNIVIKNIEISLSGKDRRVLADWREGGSSPGAQVWEDQVRSRSFRERLSRLDYLVVYL